ncbi:MAG: HAD-IB family phosphatase [Nanoarchaeota archaeon]
MKINDGFYITPKQDIPANANWLVFDMDGTITPESMDYLANNYGLHDEIAKITELGMQGKIKFEDSVKKRLELMKGIPKQKIIQTGYELPLQEGAFELVAELGYVTAMITGGFSDIACTVAERLGADVYWANELVYENEKTTDKFILNVNSNKGAIMDYIIMNHNPSKIVYIGDGSNDIPAFLKADISIATYNAKQIAKENAMYQLNGRNLYNALELIKT